IRLQGVRNGANPNFFGTAALNVTAGALVNNGLIVSQTLDGLPSPNTLGVQLNNHGTLNVPFALNLNKPLANHLNSGTISVGGGNLTVNQSFNNNGGTVEVQQGTLTFAAPVTSSGSFVVNGVLDATAL